MNDLQKYMFDIQGFLVVRNVLDQAQVAELTQLLEAGLTEDPACGETAADGAIRTHNFLHWGKPVRDLLDHPMITPLLNELLAPAFRLDHYYGMKHTVGNGLSPLHGGGNRVAGSDFYHCKNGQMYNGVTVVSWALTDGPAEGGGFVAVPGSHKANFDLPGFMDHFLNVDLMTFEENPHLLQRVEVKAGDVIIFTEALCHGAEAWTADPPRWALLYKYAPAGVAWGRHAPPSTEILELLTPNQRKLFEAPYMYPPREPVGLPS